MVADTLIQAAKYQRVSTITAMTRCVSQVHLTSLVSSGYHSQSFIPHQRGFTILHASYSSAGKMPNADTSSPHQS